MGHRHSQRATQVAQETGQTEGTELAFTGMLFQPVPWSMQTKKGMPADFEKYAADPDYVIINTPPNFMFQVSSKPLSIACVPTRGTHTASWGIRPNVIGAYTV